MNFMGMVGKASLMMDWEHHTTSKSEDIKVFATIFPEVRTWARFMIILEVGLTMRYRMTAAWSSRSVTPTLLLDVYSTGRSIPSSSI
jgi:hypothetical protein